MGLRTKDRCDTFNMLNKLPSDYVVSGAIIDNGFMQPKTEGIKYWYTGSGGADDFWTDGTHLYANGGAPGGTQQHVLNGDVWEPKTWYCADGSELTFSGSNVWSDGTHIYVNAEGGPFVLNNGIWEPKTFNGTPTIFSTSYIWTDGENIYYLADREMYILNGDTWEEYPFNFPLKDKNHYGSNIWTDGTNIYYTASESYGGSLVRDGDTWKEKTWNIDLDVSRNPIWTDGTNVYYHDPYGKGTQYILNGDTWEPLGWDGGYNANYLFTDGTNIYAAGSSNNGATAILLPTKAALYQKDGEEWWKVGSIR